MSKRRKREGNLSSLLRLAPFVRRYRGRMLVLILITLTFAFSDAGRAILAKPLLNKVFMRGGEVRGQAADEQRGRDAAGAAEGAERARLAVELAFTEEARDQIASSPNLLGAADVPVALREHELGELLQRSADTLRDTADDLAPAPVDMPEAWRDVTLGAGLQLRAYAVAQADPDQAALLSLQARELARQAGFVVVWDTLWQVFLWAIGLAVVLAVTNFGVLYLSRALVARVFVDMQNHTSKHLLQLSVRYFERESRGDLLGRLTTDLAMTSNLFSTLVDFVIRGIHLVVLLVWALVISWPLALVLTGLGVTVLLPMRMLGRKIKRSARRRQQITGDSIEVMSQVLGGIREVKAFQREDHEVARYREVATPGYLAQVRALKARAASKGVMQFFNDVAVPILFVCGSYLVVNRVGSIDVGTFAAFLGVGLLMYQPAKILGESYNTLMDALPALDRVFQLLDLRPEVFDAETPKPFKGLTQGIKFESVGFSYDGVAPVLTEIEVESTVGSLTALVGKTGAGKSTLVDLVARYADPTAGKVLFDGVDLRELSMGDVLDRVAVVPQDDFLFNETVRENIRYGRLDASDAEVEEAARQAEIHDEILMLPGGYDYLVGERGGRLSGGQVQRIAIARAILKKPQILILDEATSALDTRTEARVQRALKTLAKGSTTFVIAHRLSTVMEADQILVLDKGRVVERGKHDELVARGGVYAKLVAEQLQPQEPGSDVAAVLEAAEPRDSTATDTGAESS